MRMDEERYVHFPIIPTKTGMIFVEVEAIMYTSSHGIRSNMTILVRISVYLISIITDIIIFIFYYYNFIFFIFFIREPRKSLKVKKITLYSVYNWKEN